MMSIPERRQESGSEPGEPLHAAFALEQAVRKFCKRFQSERAAFLECIEGLAEPTERERCASLILGRLMFLSFLPGKKEMFRHFLTNQEARSCLPRLQELLASLSYLDESLFDIYQFKRKYGEIRIPDTAFARLLAFFDEFDWYLDNRLLYNTRSVTPDFLGYIFEQYSDRKQMGAYYTQEDIGIYICKNIIIPFLFDKVKEKCPTAFTSGGPIWSLLSKNPDRYIYESARRGCHLPLLPEIAAGLDDRRERGMWNQLASEEYGLPAETWREVIARRQRYREVTRRINAREITSIDELITCNLDLPQFACDIIQAYERLDLLQAFYENLQKITVLDPTCGTGAFLCAAFKVLEPLYQACLDRMQAMVEGHERQRVLPASYLASFRSILQEIARYPSREYFISQSIITQNLYGVDIMPEAVEICKLRLLLKLLAQQATGTNSAAAPFSLNIRVGNALVGFVRLQERYRQEGSLLGELDSELAREYGIEAARMPDEYAERFAAWRQRHQPLHWCAEFQEVMQNGGFAVIVGNPPYIAYSKIKHLYQILGYQTKSCANLYAYTAERVLALLRPGGRCGMIGPVSAIASKSYHSLSKLLLQKQLWISSYSNRPGKLFPGTEQRLTIVLMKNAEPSVLQVSSYRHWYKVEREHLFATLFYGNASIWSTTGMPLKSSSPQAASIFSRISGRESCPFLQSQHTGAALWVHNGPTYWVRAFAFKPDVGRKHLYSNHYHKIPVSLQADALILSAIFSSSTFYFFYKMVSNCRDLGRKELCQFPIGILRPEIAEQLERLGYRLARLLKDTSAFCTRNYPGGRVEYQEYYPALAKAILDEIDCLLAEHYGFTEEEADFIINYDIKYRMGEKEFRALPAGVSPNTSLLF